MFEFNSLKAKKNNFMFYRKQKQYWMKWLNKLTL